MAFVCLSIMGAASACADMGERPLDDVDQATGAFTFNGPDARATIDAGSVVDVDAGVVDARTDTALPDGGGNDGADLDASQGDAFAGGGDPDMDGSVGDSDPGSDASVGGGPDSDGSVGGGGPDSDGSVGGGGPGSDASVGGGGPDSDASVGGGDDGGVGPVGDGGILPIDAGGSCPSPADTSNPECLGDNDKRACIASMDCSGLLKWDGKGFPDHTNCWQALESSIGLNTTNFSTVYRGDPHTPYVKGCETPVPFDIDSLRLDAFAPPAIGYSEATLPLPDLTATDWSVFTSWRDVVQGYFVKPYGDQTRNVPPRSFWGGPAFAGLPADLAGIPRERWANDTMPDGHPNIDAMLDALRTSGGSVPPSQAAATVGRIVNQRLGSCGIPAAPKYFFVLTLAQTACSFDFQFKPGAPFGDRVNATPLAYIENLPTIDVAPQVGLAAGQHHPTDAVLWIVDPTSGCANCRGIPPE